MDGAEIAEKMAAIRKKIAEHILQTGQPYIMYVFPSGGEPVPAFAYTIGLTVLDLPELLLIGNFRPEDAHEILTILMNRAIKEDGLEDGQEVFLAENSPYPVRIIDTDDPKVFDEYAIQLPEVLLLLGLEAGTSATLAVQQVLYPDKQGRFPENPDMDPVYRVPVLNGEVTPGSVC